jgi:hypothetical protein
MVWAKDGKRIQRGLGRLEPDEVPDALLAVWDAMDPASIPQDRSKIGTLVALCRAWYYTLEFRPAEVRKADNTLVIYRRACEYVRDTIGDRPLGRLRQGGHRRVRSLPTVWILQRRFCLADVREVQPPPDCPPLLWQARVLSLLPRA